MQYNKKLNKTNCIYQTGTVFVPQEVAKYSIEMAAKRERRGNAGAKMSKLLDEEEEDDFYKTSYGGFEETENDRDYV